MNKQNKLENHIKNLGSLLVCYSGGTDSALLLYLAKKALGDKAQAVFFDSILIPEADKAEAKTVAREIGADLRIRHVDILNIPSLADNPENRCYICKRNMLILAKELAEELNLAHVAEGSHADDLNQHRPGRQAILELGIQSPFAHAGITKSEIREISKDIGLSTWDKPSYSCLMTRLPHNEPVNPELLKRIELAERFLRETGLREFRVRHRGEICALEINSAEISIFHTYEKEIRSFLEKMGYISVNAAETVFNA